MPIQDRNILKSYYNTGDTPDEPQFVDLIDSAAHLQDDLVSQAEAEAGTSTVPSIWTAERVRQSVVANSPSGNDGHDEAPI